MTDLWKHDQARIDPPEDHDDEHGDDCRCPECDPDAARNAVYDDFIYTVTSGEFGRPL